MNYKWNFFCPRGLYFVFIFFFVFSQFSTSLAQPETKLKPGTDTEMIKRLWEAAIQQKKKPDSALVIYKQSLQLSIDGNYNYGTLHTLSKIAEIYIEAGNFPESIETLKKAVSATKIPGEKAWFLRCIGDVYLGLGNHITASENYYAGLAELQKVKMVDYHDHRYISSYIGLCNSLAMVNSRFQQYTIQLDYINQAETMARKGNELHMLASILINKSGYYQQRGKPDTSLVILHEMEQIVKGNKFKDLEGDLDCALGSVYNDVGQYEKAISSLKAGLNPEILRYSFQPDRITIYSSYGIAFSLFKLKKYKEAETVLLPALARANSLHLTANIVEQYQVLAQLYRATGQYKKALDYVDTSIVLKDSIQSVEKTTAINHLEVKYKTSEKDKQLSQNQLLMAQQNNRIARKNIWMISLGSGFLLLLGAASGIYLQTRNRQKSKERENKIDVLKAAVEGGDNERTRIARELHDGIGGMLSAAMMRFSSMHHENGPIAETAAYKESMGLLREMGDEIRKTAHNLMPEVLLKQSLQEAVRIYCNNAGEEGSMEIDFQSYGSFEGILQGHKLNLYRIIQELIKNAAIHADATKILVQLLQNEGKLIVSVEDNGKGFDADEIKGGMGLQNIRARVSSMDGHLTLESKQGKGTTFIIELELKEQSGQEQGLG